MLVGSAPLESFRRGSVASWGTPPLVLDDVEVLQAMFELRSPAGREAALPPALHPTNPPTLVVQAWRTPSFSLAQVRVQCRSGLRPRGFVVGSVVDGDVDLSPWGFAPVDGSVSLARFYDAVELAVVVGGTTVLELRGADPEPLGLHDVGWSSTLNLAETPNGLRLVQLDLDVEPSRVERVSPSLSVFEAGAWGNEVLDPWYAVAGSIAVGSAVLPPVRYVCRPDVLAFEGTETVS